MSQTNSSIFGPYQESKFANATISSFQISANWGEQSTYFNATVVEDVIAGDDFLYKDGNANYDGGQIIGTPMSFVFGGFRFDGLLKSVDKIVDITSNPTYRVTLVSPIEVLDACQVVLDSYVGPNSDIIFNSAPQNSASFQVSNLLNVFGYAEGGGANFGRSLVTSIGMPWVGTYGIQNVLTTLTNTPPGPASASNFGSYIQYRGHSYKLDLSNLPTPPSYYMLGGVVNMSLLELLSKFFQDAGCDYMVKLTINPTHPTGPHIISFVVVPRFVQQQLGQIGKFIQGQTNLSSVTHGEELRSDITQAFLVGGAVSILQPLQNTNVYDPVIMPFWGFDINGNAIIGAKPDGTYYADDAYEMTLNGSKIADILGELGLPPMYPSTILEMRCALSNYDTWALYLSIYQPKLASQLGIFSAWDALSGENFNTVADFINDDPALVDQFGIMYEDNHWPAVAQRLYSFVREQADTYYGKKFIVKLPFQMQIKIDPTTGQVTLSDELADAGFMPEGSNILGLSFINENFFLDQTGRFIPFVRSNFTNVFNSVAGQKTVTADIAYLNSSANVAQYNVNPANSYIFAQSQQGEGSPVLQNGLISGGGDIFFVPNGIGIVTPATVVTISEAVFTQAEDILGSTTDLAAMMGIDVDSLLSILDFKSTSVNIILHPPAIYPNGVALALKSNQFIYGPWGKYAAAGKLEFEQDDGLVPWEYGGYDLMNQAAIAKLNTIATGNQVLERADFTQAGIPTNSVGDVMVAGGPILTSVQCNVSTNEVTTSYTMQTFVNRIGAFTIENAERLKRIGKLYQQLRRTMRQLIIETNKRNEILTSNYLGFMYGTTYAVEQHTPHGVMGGTLAYGTGQTYFPQLFTQTYQESLGNLGTKTSASFQSHACVGMEALYRPFTMQQSLYYMSPYLSPDTGKYNVTNMITSSGLNPYKQGCDINWVVSGTGYQGMRTSKNVIDWTTVRSIAQTLPIIQAWGYDIQNAPVPNSNAQIQVPAVNGGTVMVPDLHAKFQDVANGSFFTNYLQNSIFWPTGPLDIRWNKVTSTWTTPGIVFIGQVSGSPLVPGGTCKVRLNIAGSLSNEYIVVKNPFVCTNASVATGVTVICGYDILNSTPIILNADCC